MPPSHHGSTSAGRAEAVAHHPSPGHRSPYRCGCRRRRGEASRRRPSESPSRSRTRPAGRDGWWQTGTTAPIPLWRRLPHRHQTHSQQTHSPVTSRPPRWRCAELLRQVFAVDAFAARNAPAPCASSRRNSLAQWRLGSADDMPSPIPRPPPMATLLGFSYTSRDACGARRAPTLGPLEKGGRRAGAVRNPRGAPRAGRIAAGRAEPHRARPRAPRMACQQIRTTRHKTCWPTSAGHASGVGSRHERSSGSPLTQHGGSGAGSRHLQDRRVARPGPDGRRAPVARAPERHRRLLRAAGRRGVRRCARRT